MNPLSIKLEAFYVNIIFECKLFIIKEKKWSILHPPVFSLSNGLTTKTWTPESIFGSIYQMNFIIALKYLSFSQLVIEMKTGRKV